MGYSGSAVRDLEAAGWKITETFHGGGSVADWHEHDAGHYCLVVAGRLVDESPVARRECRPGTLLFFPSSVPHRDRFLDRGVRCLNLRPPGEPDAGAGGAPGAEVPCVRVCEHRASWLAARLYDRIRVDAARPRPSSDELEGLLEASAGDRPEHPRTSSARHASGRTSGTVRPTAWPREPEWLSRAGRLIEEEWADDMRLGTVAERVGVSRYHLARRFRERFGCSVGEYVHRLRVTHARHLLLATDASLSEIAFATGFADQSHFTRIFGRHVGTSPARYRAAA